MSRRTERARKRLERIHAKRLREQAERIMACVQRDACDHPDCMYFALPEDVTELMAFACDVLGANIPETGIDGGASDCACGEGT